MNSSTPLGPREMPVCCLALKGANMGHDWNVALLLEGLLPCSY